MENMNLNLSSKNINTVIALAFAKGEHVVYKDCAELWASKDDGRGASAYHKGLLFVYFAHEGGCFNSLFGEVVVKKERAKGKLSVCVHFVDKDCSMTVLDVKVRKDIDDNYRGEEAFDLWNQDLVEWLEEDEEICPKAKANDDDCADWTVESESFKAPIDAKVNDAEAEANANEVTNNYARSPFLLANKRANGKRYSFFYVIEKLSKYGYGSKPFAYDMRTGNYEQSIRVHHKNGNVYFAFPNNFIGSENCAFVKPDGTIIVDYCYLRDGKQLFRKVYNNGVLFWYKK